MNYTIRPYRNSDFEMIHSWWTQHNECPPLEGMMVEDGTFVLELDNVPALSLTVFLTQSKEIAYLEGFIKNPSFKQSLHEYAQLLWNHCFDYTKSKGYSRLVCYCLVPKLSNKYQRFGMQKSADSLTSFVKEL